MMDVAKVIEIVASSPKSFEDAMHQGIQKASSSLHGITGVKVKDWTAKVENNHVTKYKVIMDVAFRLDD